MQVLTATQSLTSFFSLIFKIIKKQKTSLCFNEVVVVANRSV